MQQFLFPRSREESGAQRMNLDLVTPEPKLVPFKDYPSKGIQPKTVHAIHIHQPVKAVRRADRGHWMLSYS